MRFINFSDLVENSGIISQESFGRFRVSAKKSVYMTLWYLSNTETFRQIADRFNVTLSTAFRIIDKITKFLLSQSSRFIKWPEEEIQTIRDGFFKLKRINHVIGAVDGCHINIKRPSKDPHVYCNRKGNYSILLQAVCDDKKRFIDVFCGEAGSLHDCRLLKKSSLYERGMNGNFGTDILLGDSAYPCLPWLIPPYKDNGNLTQQQKVFNYNHSATRIVIENAFGLLKGRFRRLTYFNNNSIEFIVQCVIAACVLHNICITYTDLWNSENDDNSAPQTVPATNLIEDMDIGAGNARREEIAQEMSND